MTCKALPIILFVAAFGATAVSAAQPTYTIEDVTACSSDAMRLCRDKLPDLDAIQACMKVNFEKLHPACKARFNRE